MRVLLLLGGSNNPSSESGYVLLDDLTRPAFSDGGFFRLSVSSTVSWTDNSDDETGFDIEWGKDLSYSTGSAQVEANVEEYEIEDLDQGRLYFVRVRSFNLAGPSGWVEGSFVAI